MTKKQTLGLFFLGGLSAIIACDNGSGGTTSGLGSDDCPLGMFRPVGLPDCVVPALDQNSQPVAVADNRCAANQGAVPPSCVSESGGRAYISASMTCASGYRYLPGACNRGFGGSGGFGNAGTTGTGGFSTGTAGVTTGAAGCVATGEGGAAGNCSFGVDTTTNECLPSPFFGFCPPAAGGAGGASGASGAAGF